MFQTNTNALGGLKAKLGIGIAVIVGAGLLFSSTSLFESLDSGDVMVIQYPNGTLRVVTEPGIYPQMFGHVTKYHRREQFSFHATVKEGSYSESGPLKITFNDGGTAMISGVVSWEMPLVPEKIVEIHKDFRSQEGVEQQLIKPTINSAVFSTGPLMSSTESSGEKRTSLFEWINDQALNGIYKRVEVSKKVVDLVSGVEKQTLASEILIKDGLPARTTESPFKTYGINLLPVSINAIDYDDVVKKQIAERQNQITQVQTAIAQARKAEQQAITVAREGEAAAAKAKWEQEVEKAKAVTKAQQEKEVAELAVKTAELNKKTLTLEGEGEAAKRMAVMNADGGLDKKLEAYIKVNAIYAEAIKGNKWVPDMVFGNSGTNGVTNAQTMIDLMTAKTAKELGLDLGIAGQNKTAKK